MPERAPQPATVSPEELRQAEVVAYAMKPEMDLMAEERAAAPRKAPVNVPGQDGLIHTVSGPDLSPVKLAEHSKRRQFAENDAANAERFDRTMRDHRRERVERMVARGQLHELLADDRQPKPTH